MTKTKQIYNFLKSAFETLGVSIVNDATEVKNGSIITFEQVATNYDRKPRVPFYQVTATFALKIETQSKLNNIDNLLNKFDELVEIVETNISKVEKDCQATFPGIESVNISSVSPDMGSPGDSLIGECAISLEVKFALKV